MVFRYALETLAIMPTWECDAACHHCVFSSSPASKERLPIGLALRAIREAADVSTIKRATVSGGEAFLDTSYLLDIASTCRDQSLAFRVVTNASFATSPARAIECLRPLSEIGLEAVAISWDSFHAKFISSEAIRNCIVACRKLGVSARVTVVVSKTSRIEDALGALGDQAYELPVTQVRCLPVGRAERKIDAADLLPTPESDRGRACRSDFDTLSLTPTGDVFPCCAVGGFTDGIKLGNYPTESIETLLRRRDSDLLWVILAAQGPKFFTDRLTALEKATIGIGDSQHDCVTCNKLFRTAQGSSFARRIVGEIRAEASQLCQGFAASHDL